MSTDKPANPCDELAAERRFGLAGLALVQCLAAAEDHVEAGGQGNPYLLVDERIGFAQIMPALAVSENNVLAAGIEEHLRADLAGERAFLRGIKVLRPSATRLPLSISPTRAR